MELPQIALDGRRCSVEAHHEGPIDGHKCNKEPEPPNEQSSDAKARWRKAGTALNAVDRIISVKDNQLVSLLKREEYALQHVQQRLGRMQQQLWKETEEKEKLQLRLQEQAQEMDQMSDMLKMAQFAVSAKDGARDDTAREMAHMRDEYNRKVRHLTQQLHHSKVRTRVTLQTMYKGVRNLQERQRDATGEMQQQIAQITSAARNDLHQGIQQLCEMVEANAAPVPHRAVVVKSPDSKTKPLDFLKPIVAALEKAVFANALAVNDAIERTDCPIATVAVPMREDTERATVDSRLEGCTTFLKKLQHVTKQMGTKLQDRIRILSSREFSNPEEYKLKPLQEELENAKNQISVMTSQIANLNMRLTAEATQHAKKVDSMQLDLREARQRLDEAKLELKQLRALRNSRPEPQQAFTDNPAPAQRLEPVDPVERNWALCYKCCGPDQFPTTCSKCFDDLPYGPRVALPRKSSLPTSVVPSQSERQMHLTRAITLAETALDSMEKDDSTTEISKFVTQVSEAIQVSSKKPKKISAAEQAAIAQLRNWMQKRKEAFERRERVLRECFKLLQMSKLSMAADPAPEANARAFEGPRALESWQQLPMRIPAPPSFVGSHMGPHSFLSSPGPGSGRRPRPRDLGPRFSPRAPRNQSPLKVKDVKPSCEAQSAFGEFSVDSARLLPNIHQSTGVS